MIKGTEFEIMWNYEKIEVISGYFKQNIRHLWRSPQYLFICIHKVSLQLNEGICLPAEIWNSSLESCWYSAAQMLHCNLNHDDDVQLNEKFTYVKTFNMCNNWERNNLHKYNTTMVDDLKLIQNLLHKIFLWHSFEFVGQSMIWRCTAVQESDQSLNVLIYHQPSADMIGEFSSWSYNDQNKSSLNQIKLNSVKLK